MSDTDERDRMAEAMATVVVAEGFASRDYWKHTCWSYMAESAARANLLTRVVNAVRGNPPYPLAWSHQDAPERVAGVVAERDALAAQVAAVTTLHFRCGPDGAIGYCHECVLPWPCPTIAAIKRAGQDPT